jgi:hypothetical protein
MLDAAVLELLDTALLCLRSMPDTKSQSLLKRDFQVPVARCCNCVHCFAGACWTSLLHCAHLRARVTRCYSDVRGRVCCLRRDPQRRWPGQFASGSTSAPWNLRFESANCWPETSEPCRHSTVNCQPAYELLIDSISALPSLCFQPWPNTVHVGSQLTGSTDRRCFGLIQHAPDCRTVPLANSATSVTASSPGLSGPPESAHNRQTKTRSIGAGSSTVGVSGNRKGL